MRIAVFVEYLPPKMGSDRRIFEIMKRLSHKHEVHFIIFPPVRILLNNTPKNKDKFHLHLQRKTVTENHEGIIGHFISIPTKISLMWQYSVVVGYLLTSILIFIKTSKILRKVKPNIIVLNYPSPYTGLLGFLEGKLWKKPVVLDFNDLIAQYTISLLNLKKNSFKAKLLILIQHYIIKKSQKIIVPTQFIKKYTVALRASEKNITVIPNGVDPKNFDSSKYDVAEMKIRLGLGNEKTCFYCGRLDEWAGINIISKLCKIAKDKKLNAKFVLVGSGAEKAVYKENVILLGEISYEKIPPILTTADVILIPFPNNEVSHAASPLKLYEGMAMQKPVIASKVSGIEEVVSDGENGFLADPNNINEWVEKLETVFKSETLAAKIGKNARRTVEERFDWTLLADQFEEVLNAVIFRHQQL